MSGGCIITRVRVAFKRAQELPQSSLEGGGVEASDVDRPHRWVHAPKERQAGVGVDHGRGRFEAPHDETFDPSNEPAG